jgi:hypothetical protein
MNPPNDIDRAIAYCATLDPTFESGILGASPEQIEDVEDLLRRPLVGEHRRYLERMGASTGSLSFGLLNSSAHRVAKTLSATYGEPEPGYELFAVGEDEPFEDLYLVERQGSTTLELLSSRLGTAHATLAGDAGIVVAGSIAELMCRTMLQTRIVAPMPWRQTLALPPGNWPEIAEPWKLEEFDRTATQLGLPLLWFSSETTRVAASEGMVVIARQAPRLQLLITISANDEQACIAAGRALTQNLGLERLPLAM